MLPGNVAQEFTNLNGLDLDDAIELVESTQDSLDEVWKQEDHKPYPETRMKHFLDVIAGALGRYVQHKLGTLDIWQGQYQHVKDSLKKGISVCERWVSTCEILTSQYWKRFPSHPWKDEKFVPERMSLLAARLEEVKKRPIFRFFFIVLSLVPFFSVQYESIISVVYIGSVF